MKTFSLLLTLTIVAVLTTSGTRAADPPPELSQLNEGYENALKAAREPVDAKYIEALTQLIDSLTRAGRLDDAIAVRDTLQRAKAKPGAAPTPGGVATNPPPAIEPTPPRPEKPESPFRPDGERPEKPGSPFRPDGERPVESDAAVKLPDGSFVLNASSAALEGSLKLNNGNIENWLRSSSRAAWTRREIPAGKYDVFLVYDAAADMGGTLEMEDFGFRLSVSVTPTSDEDSVVEEYVYDSTASSGRYKTVPNSRRDPVYKRLKAGTATTRGGIGLKVSPRDASERGILNLREIQLVPAA